MIKKTMIKKSFLYIIVILSGLLLVFSCAQDAIFYKISTETAPKKPRIPGAPTNMVVFNREYPDPNDSTGTKTVPIMYVASGILHWYAKTERGNGASNWDSKEYYIPQPGGRIISLAATQDYLYALSISSSAAVTTLRRIGPSEDNWGDPISIDESPYTKLQTIYADGTDWLLAGAMNNKGSDYGILFLDDNSDPPVLRLLIINTEMLSGAAKMDNNYYLSTIGNGVFKVPKTDLSPDTVPVSIDAANYRLKDSEYPNITDPLFMGMIKLDTPSAIIVIERNGGTLFEVKETGFRRIRYNTTDGIDVTVATGRYATGSLAVWQQVLDSGTPKKMFTAGIQGGLYSTSTSSSYTHGYAEFDFDFSNKDGWLVFNNRRDTGPDWTVDGNKDRYSATIGKHPINCMYQVPKEIDDKMIFFASTQTAGLWSYRERSDGLQWNAEGTNEP